MSEHSVSRTLVKSPPELWAELSDPAALARHLGEFGEIAITRLEPERSVAWEGERARGTVALEPAGWGTRVTLEVVAEEAAAPLEVVAEEAPAPSDVVAEEAEESEAEPVEEPAVAPLPAPAGEEPPAEPAAPAETSEPADEPPAPRRGFLARLFGRRRRPVEEAVERPVGDEEEEPAAEAAGEDPVEAVVEEAAGAADPGIEAVLTATLDTLGGANHRPFSRG